LPAAKWSCHRGTENTEEENVIVFFCAFVLLWQTKNSRRELNKNHCSPTSWLMNFLGVIKAESYKRGTALSVLFNIISKGILFLLTIIIARYFGSNIKTDIYFFVFAAMILFSSFINAIDTAVLIPQSMQLREKEGDTKAMDFLNYFLLIYFIIGVVFTVAMYFFGTTVFGLISKFAEADIMAYHNYFWTGSLFFIFHVLTNYLNNILTSLKFFSLPMVISSVKSCVVIACIFLLKAKYDVMSVIIGGLISYAINLIIQIYVLQKNIGWKFMFKKPTIQKKTWSNIFYAELGQAATVASSMFPLYLLSGFGSGIISIMNYGKNIADIPNTLVTSQFANVSGIKLNKEFAKHDYQCMNNTFLRTSKLMVFILVPMGFYSFVFATPVVEFFYKSSNFNDEAVKAAAVFFKLLAITIFSMGINAMVTRVFIAVQAVKQAFYYQVALNILLIAAIWICTSQFGAYGYAWAIMIVNVINWVLMYFICKKLVPFIDYLGLFKYTAQIILINGLIAAALFFAADNIHISNLGKLIAGFLLYLIILLVLNKKFKLNKEAAQIINYAKKKIV
jgi:putative peptidoglycan lipid II flippase